MKKIFAFTAALIIAATLMGQAPSSFKYQAVLRDARGNIKANTATNIIIAILQGSATGTTVYSETHSVTTDGYGLINLELGKGTATIGTMSAINWGAGVYFVKVTVDGVEMGTGQLLSVPYALYAAKAANGFSGSYSDLTNKPTLFDGTWVSLTGKPSLATVATSGSYADLSNKPALFDGTWLSLSGKPTTIAGYGITDAVTTAGNQTISGNKTFSGTITVTTPVNTTDAATKAYVDAVIEQLYAQGALRVRDYDCNYYNTIKIGNQIWMTENLKTTRFNDGTQILLVIDSTAWGGLATPGYCWYDNDYSKYADTYGALYNWYTVDPASNGGKNVCPTGWHIPTDNEWYILESFVDNTIQPNTVDLRGTDVGAKLKSTVMNGIDLYGFSALPGGYRGSSGSKFSNIDMYLSLCGNWWARTQNDENTAWRRSLYYDYSTSRRNPTNKRAGYSLRCTKD